MRHNIVFIVLIVLLASTAKTGYSAVPDAWRSLPLITTGKVDPAWGQVGWGGFAVENGALRTECSEKGLGLLVYRLEKFGNCRIRVVYKSIDAKSNAGVYVRMDDGILAKIGETHAPGQRGPDGKLTKESLQVFMDASENGTAAWYAVHHGYEVQIGDTGDPFHRTGAIYGLAPAAEPSGKPAAEWKTMIITLQGNLILVDVDGRRVTTFDPAGKEIPPRKNWTEPRRETQRPFSGYIGLQNHDPADVVWFKEVSIQPLDD